MPNLIQQSMDQKVLSPIQPPSALGQNISQKYIFSRALSYSLSASQPSSIPFPFRLNNTTSLVPIQPFIHHTRHMSLLTSQPRMQDFISLQMIQRKIATIQTFAFPAAISSERTNEVIDTSGCT